MLSNSFALQDFGYVTCKMVILFLERIPGFAVSFGLALPAL